jgi:dipeptidyl aminopeptidase/acylaminoacyl peptidase
LGAKITEVPELVKAANPVTYIRENTPPFLIQHGVNDPVVPVQHSIELADVLKDACGENKVRLDLIDGAEHGDPKFASPLNVKKVLDYLDHQLI